MDKNIFMIVNNAIKIATCPHGSSPGGCPICSGMGGGGASPKRNTGEMSWGECYSIGLMLKAARQNAELNKANNENYLIQNALFSKQALALAQSISGFKNFILQSTLVQTIVKTLNNVAVPIKQIVNLISNAGSLIAKTINNIKTEFIDITDKLAAIWGEKELSLRKFASDSIEKAKKRIFAFLGFVDETNKQSEHADEVEQQKRRILNFGKLKYKIIQIFQKTKEQK
jgi:hypothetical protein